MKREVGRDPGGYTGQEEEEKPAKTKESEVGSHVDIM